VEGDATMTYDQIDNAIKSIASKPGLSAAGLQVEMMALLCKVIAAPKIAPDQYMIDIKDFHEKFGLPYNGGPRNMTPEMADFRIKFLQEELDEFIEGVKHDDLEKQFDALIDLVYVALGTAYLQGFPFQRGWQRVQEANMKKERTGRQSMSKRGSSLDITKPRGWTPPYLTDLVNQIE
jgi:predicted HAD superfamily Cof-like phosphohydrolase